MGLIPQTPKSDSIRDRAIASVIDRINLNILVRKRGWIFKETIIRWCKDYYCINLTETDINYIQQNTNIVIIDEKDITIIDEETKEGD